MTKTRSTASEIQDIAKSITCLVSRLQMARMVNPAHAVAIMSIIASRYRQAIEDTPAPHLIAELPGNAALWKAMASETGTVDENLYDRLKATISPIRAKEAPSFRAGRNWRLLGFGRLMFISRSGSA